MTAALLVLLSLAATRPEGWGHDPAGWRARASSGRETVHLAWDDRRDSAWQTDGAMQAGDWFELDLGAQVTVGRLQTEPGANPRGVPRGLRLELHDGRGWRPVEAEQLIAEDGTLRLTFAPRAARRLRLTNGGSIPETPWAMAELYVWER